MSVDVNDDPARKRYDLILKAFEKFKREFRDLSPDSRELNIDPVIVYQVAKSYEIDLARFKTRNLSVNIDDPNDPKNFADDVKQYAFQLYWLVKLRPVYSPEATVSYPQVAKDAALMGNALFAFAFCSNFQETSLDGKLLTQLLYTLTYREMTKDGYLMIASMIKVLGESRGAVGLKKRNEPTPLG